MSFLKSLVEKWRTWQVRNSIPLLDRYIASELIPTFFLGTGIFSSLGVAIGYLSDLINKVIDANLPLTSALEILLLKVPEFIAYALPISVLLATLLTYSRLSSDSELVALRSCGISLYRLIAPTLILSFFVAIALLGFNETVVPAANYRATSILVDAIKEEHPFWQTKDIFYPDYEEVQLANGDTVRKLKSLFYAEQFDGKRMKTLTIVQWLGQNLNQIVVSDSATWNFQEDIWDFFDGTIYEIAPDASYQDALTFDHRQLAISRVPFDLALQGRNPYEMNVSQAFEYMKLLRLIGDERKLLTFQVRTQQKLALPFICLVFALVGATLGSRPRYASRATSFGLCLAIVFTYYIVAFLIGSLGMAGVLSPLMAGWLPNLLGLATGTGLLHRYAQ